MFLNGSKELKPNSQQIRDNSEWIELRWDLYLEILMNEWLTALW